MKRPRLKKWAKWGCTLAAVLVAGFATSTRFYSYSLEFPANGGRDLRFVSVCTGRLWVGEYRNVPPQGQVAGPDWNMGRYSGWHWCLVPDPSDIGAEGAWHWGVLWSSNQLGRFAGVSVIYPAALTSLVAGLLWYTGRRFKPGQCNKCRYDRRGLTPAAPCPECGTMQAPGPAA